MDQKKIGCPIELSTKDVKVSIENFMGEIDPYTLKTTSLKIEINQYS